MTSDVAMDACSLPSSGPLNQTSGTRTGTPDIPRTPDTTGPPDTGHRTRTAGHRTPDIVAHRTATGHSRTPPGYVSHDVIALLLAPRHVIHVTIGRSS